MQVNQICYSTHDIEATARSLAETDQIGPFYIGAFPLNGTIYRGRTVEYGSIRVGFGYRAGLQYELIEAPKGQPSCYAEVLDGRREALHHVYHGTDEDYDAIVARYAAAGEELAYHGLAGEGVRFGFIDAMSRLGHFVEVLETDKIVGEGRRIYDIYERIEAASRGWDGGRPIRPLGEAMT